MKKIIPFKKEITLETNIAGINSISLEHTLEKKEELADKLELIRAMAEYNGFTLEDIIEEADRKKERNGGFEKRLLLERVIKK